jgi:hypothetical protein
MRQDMTILPSVKKKVMKSPYYLLKKNNLDANVSLLKPV